MAGAKQDGVKVLVFLQMVFVKRELAIGGVGLAQAPDGFQPVGAQVGQDVFNAPEAIGAGSTFKPISAQDLTNCSST